MDKKTNTKGGSNIRLLRIGENIRHSLATILHREDMRDPALEGVSITVCEVRAAPDLRNATVYVLPLGGENQEEVLKALNRAAPYLSGQVSQTQHLKYMPKLKFEADETFDESSHISSLLSNPKVAADLKKED
ncbi:MAG: 30S ribosome-binding factor RbfA [Alphaproteobacteria bacterium]|nr:MAG: 30S ribosome-binding factor RbfA [Alphaproteobacteria bacterium]